MRVIADVLLAVAVVAIAAGAVPELQLRIGNVGASADGTPMGVGGFNRSGCCLVGAGNVEGNGFVLGGVF